ncbi:MAG: hypothetical protein HQ532_02705, partial [Candidatus Omnitrophica bacterium]|nr:hypothetical protein [Candidatus Omnitrophota bacterium]
MKNLKSNTKDDLNLELFLVKKLGICLFRYQLSPKERLSTINSTLAKMLGYSSDKKIKNFTFKSLFKNPEDAKDFVKTIKKEKIVKFYEAEFKRKDKK